MKLVASMSHRMSSRMRTVVRHVAQRLSDWVWDTAQKGQVEGVRADCEKHVGARRGWLIVLRYQAASLNSV